LALLGKKLAIAIPDTVLEERDSPRDKTVKLGLIARACAIYGVDLVEVFRDERGRGEPRTVRKVLQYLETPQYLRRRLFALDESLKFAGLLPPLRIPSHKPKVPVDRLTVGDFREGVTNANGTVDVGLDRTPRLGQRVAANKRVTVRVTSKTPFTVEIVPKSEVHEYWGYDVEGKELDEVISDARISLKVATSRYGNSLQSQVFQLRQSILQSGSVKLIFGSPSRGLFDMVGRELSTKVNYVINLFADQHAETVRTEEAIFAGLGLVNTLAV